MILDLTKYKAILPGIENIIKGNSNRSKSDIATMAAQATMAPVGVCCFYVGNIMGFDEDLNKTIESIKTFYGYKEIIGEEEFRNVR